MKTGGRLLSAAGNSFRKRTSTRIIPPVADVGVARDDFYSSLSEPFTAVTPTLDMLINFDQTFHLYNPNRGYTWEKKGSNRVQLHSNKDGFTLCPVISAAGIIGAQLIFGGSTTGVHPRVAPGPLLRYTHTANHWSNEDTTLALFKDIIIPYVESRRLLHGTPDAPALVLADAFSAHWTQAVKDYVGEQHAIVYIAVPDCLTHLFQPLDLGVIAAIKQSILRRKDDFMEQEVATAIREGRGVILSKSRPVLREKIAMWIKETLSDPNICAEHCCRSGFDRAGITRAMYGGNTIADVDLVLPPPTCEECGEFGLLCEELPTCAHFGDVASMVLCTGCIAQHNDLCEQR